MKHRTSKNPTFQEMEKTRYLKKKKKNETPCGHGWYWSDIWQHFTEIKLNFGEFQTYMWQFEDLMELLGLVSFKNTFHLFDICKIHRQT